MLLNTLILTDNDQKAIYSKERITKEEARQAIKKNGFESAIGHAATARVMSRDLGVEIPVRRIEAKQILGQVAICFKVKGRPEEGKILDEEQIEKLGYDYYALIMVA